MISYENKGIATRISDRNSYGMNPRQIINEHYKFAKKNDSPVYFSTNNKQDKRFKNRLDEIIFFFKEKNEMVYVKARIIRIESSKTAFIPEDAAKFSPAIFAKDERCSWYLIEDFEVVDEVALNDYWYRNNETMELEPLVDVLKRPRFPKCYFEFKSANLGEDILL